MAKTVLQFVTGVAAGIVMALLLTSCSSPAAEFTANVDTCKPGDTVHLENKSRGSDIFEWYLNDQQIGNTENLSYVVGETESGPLVFKLVASAEGKQASMATRTVMVVATTGTVSVWSTFPGLEVLRVKEEAEESAGTTTQGFTDDPGCNAGGCVAVVLVPGTHTIDGVSPITRTRRIIAISAGECASVKMH